MFMYVEIYQLINMYVYIAYLPESDYLLNPLSQAIDAAMLCCIMLDPEVLMLSVVAPPGI